MQYRQKILSGFSYHYAFKILSALIALLKLSVSARLLTREDFGLFSLTLIAIGLTESFTETGINTTILQSKQSVKYFLNTAWVIAIFRGLLIAVLMLLLGFWMSHYYDEKRLLFLIALASLIPLIKGFINPAIITYYKKMAFLSDTMYRLSLVIVNTTLSIILVFYFRSVFSLIWAILLTGIFEVLLSFVLFKNKPKFEFIKSRAQTIFTNTKSLSVSAALDYLNENLDNLLIGKVTSIGSLGIYQNTYTITHKLYEIAQAAHHGSLPAYIKIHKDKKRLRATVIKVAGLTMLGILLIASPLLLFPKFFILLVLGKGWLDAVPLMRILILAAILQSFSILMRTIFISTKKYMYMNLHLFLTVSTLVISVLFLGSRYGLIGAVWGVLLSRLLTLPIVIWGAVRSTQ